MHHIIRNNLVLLLLDLIAPKDENNQYLENLWKIFSLDPLRSKWVY